MHVQILFDYKHLGADVFDRFSVNADEVVWYYKSLLEVFEKSWPENPIVSDLRLAVNDLEDVVQTDATLVSG